MLRLLAGKRDGMWNERSQTFKKSERMSAPNVKKLPLQGRMINFPQHVCVHEKKEQCLGQS